MSITNLFPIPVGWYQHDEGLTESEKKFLLTQDEKPNEGNTTSHYRYLLRDKKLSNLNQWIDECVEKYFDEVYKPKMDVELYTTQSWVNYTKKGQWHHKHRHPNSFVSGVYYVQAEEMKDKIFFFHPKVYHQLRITPPRDWNIYNSESWWFGVKTGSLVLFPSSLEHWVAPVEADQTRVSLSFNTFLKGYVGDDDSLTGLHLGGDATPKNMLKPKKQSSPGKAGNVMTDKIESVDIETL